MLRAKAQHGLPDSPDYHTCCDYDTAHSPANVTVAINRLWRLAPPPTAIVCFSTILARDVVMTLRNRKLRCPEDVSVLGRGVIDSHPPACSLLGSDAARLGQSAAEHLLNRLMRASAGPAHLSIPSVLLEGPTTAPPRAQDSTQ